MAGQDSADASERRPPDLQLEAAGVDRGRVLGQLSRRQLLRRTATAAGAVAIVALAIAELPGLHAVRARFAHANPGWIVIAVVMEAASIGCFTLALQRAFKDTLAPCGAVSLGTTAQGVNAVVPAGGTAGYAFAAVILADAGCPVAPTVGRLVALFLISSVVTNLVLVVVGGGGASFGLLGAHASLAASLVPAVIAIALLIVLARASRSAVRAGPSPAGLRPARARGPLSVLHEAIGVGGELVRAHDPWLAVGAAGYVVCDLLALAAVLVALGWGGLGAGTVILGYTLGQIGSVIPLPGATEGGLAGALALFGAPLNLAIAGVLVYRTVAIGVPLVLAAFGAVHLRHGLEVTDAQDAAWAAHAS
jgi:uncharacterized membrane protein YbhN (UPF0104 family)